MSKFIRSLSLFVAGLPLLATRTEAAAPATSAQTPPTEPGPVSLRPLNFDRDNLFAGHRSHSSHSSHSSHASHSSHYSGSSGSSAAPSPPAPAARLVPEPASAASRPNYLLEPSPRIESNAPTGRSGAPGSAASMPRAQNIAPAGPQLTLEQKRRLQIMRVQIALTSLGLYDGRIDGTLNAETRLGLERFQDVKGFPKSGQMTTDTLNALGVPAVN